MLSTTSSSSFAEEVEQDHVEALLSTLSAMHRQEEEDGGGYRKYDYIHQEQQRVGVMIDIDVECRTKMITWCYQVIDFCKFDRSTCEITMSYLDRFLSTPSGAAALADRNTFQLVCMTCLYTAVKIHEPTAIDPKLVAVLSRGVYTEQQIVETEAILLSALQWRMNPPIASAYVPYLMQLLLLMTGRNRIHSEKFDNEQIQDIITNLTQIQIELAVSDYNFITIPSSIIAYCSILNAIESVVDDTSGFLRQIEIELGRAIHLDMTNENVNENIQKQGGSSGSSGNNIYKMIKLVQQELCDACVASHHHHHTTTTTAATTAVAAADPIRNNKCSSSSSTNNNHNNIGCSSGGILLKSRFSIMDTSSHTAML